MRRNILIMGVLLLPAVGCSSMNNTEAGLLGGGAVGAGIGALATRGNPVGALLGGALGAAVGGAAGSDQDRREDRRAYVNAVANAQAARQMSINDIIQMSQRGMAEDIIIRQIQETNSVFNLTTNDLIDLQNQNVSRNVIAFMQSRHYAQPVVVAPPPVVYGPPPAVIVYERGYGRY
jgi:hypothetical protein